MASDTRARILEAALACFLQDGYEQTTVARICERAGVSNGALFHHFSSKDAISDAIYVDGMASFQAGLWDLLSSRPRSLRAAVLGTVHHQLHWTEQHSALARFIYMRGHLDWESPASAELAALNSDLAGAYGEWMEPLVSSGEVRPTSMLVLSAIVNGPAHAIARRWLAGQIDRSPVDYAEELADAACAALRGTRVRARRAPAMPRQSAHLTLQLVSDDGQVLAEGRATAELLPLVADAAQTTTKGE